MKKKSGKAARSNAPVALIILATAFVVTAVYCVVLQSKLNTSASAQTNDWKIYSNDEMGVALYVPSDVALHESVTGEGSQQAIFTSETENFDVIVTAGGATKTLEDYDYLGQEKTGTTTLDGEEAVILESENGRCDGTNCSDPFVVYATKKDGKFYNVIFYGDTELSEAEEIILSSFTFIE